MKLLWHAPTLEEIEAMERHTAAQYVQLQNLMNAAAELYVLHNPDSKDTTCCNCPICKITPDPRFPK